MAVLSDINFTTSGILHHEESVICYTEKRKKDEKICIWIPFLFLHNLDQFIKKISREIANF